MANLASTRVVVIGPPAAVVRAFEAVRDEAEGGATVECPEGVDHFRFAAIVPAEPEDPGDGWSAVAAQKRAWGTKWDMPLPEPPTFRDEGEVYTADFRITTANDPPDGALAAFAERFGLHVYFGAVEPDNDDYWFGAYAGEEGGESERVDREELPGELWYVDDVDADDPDPILMFDEGSAIDWLLERAGVDVDHIETAPAVTPDGPGADARHSPAPGS